MYLQVALTSRKEGVLVFADFGAEGLSSNLHGGESFSPADGGGGNLTAVHI